MSVNISNNPQGADESAPPADRVAWLPRARLRSGGRGDRALTVLTVLTAAVLAAAAGVAAYARHSEFLAFDLASLQIFSGEGKAVDRAPAPVQPPPPTVRTVAPPPVPRAPGHARTGPPDAGGRRAAPPRRDHAGRERPAAARSCRNRAPAPAGATAPPRTRGPTRSGRRRRCSIPCRPFPRVRPPRSRPSRSRRHSPRRRPRRRPPRPAAPWRPRSPTRA